MTLDDSVSEEEEEEGSFDELTDVNPYLQPGVEISMLNEVRRESCLVATLVNIFPKNVSGIYDATFTSCIHAS